MEAYRATVGDTYLLCVFDDGSEVHIGQPPEEFRQRRFLRALTVKVGDITDEDVAETTWTMDRSGFGGLWPVQPRGKGWRQVDYDESDCSTKWRRQRYHDVLLKESSNI
jgi:hypothetical protein